MRGSMRERSPGVWELRVFLGEDRVTGNKRYLSRTVRGGKRLATTTLARLVAADDTPSNRRRLAPAKLTLAELIDAHIERHPGSPTTKTEYAAVHRRYIRPLVGRLPVAEVDAGILDSFYEYLGNERGLAPSTVRQVHAIIRGALSRAVKWGWLPANPARDASPPTVRQADLVLPSVDAVAQAVKAAHDYNPAFGLFVRLAATTGARRGELCALRWEAVDLVDATVRIEASGYSERGGPVQIKDTKNHSRRVVSLDDSTVASLSDHLEQLVLRASACGTELSPESFVFSHDADGLRPWRPDYVSGTWTRLRDKIGLAGVRLHDLRHFQATMLLQHGIPVKDVSKRIGHRDAATTLNVYAHVLETTDRRAAELMGSLLPDR